MTWEILGVIVALSTIIIYIINLKDVYYAYGRAVVFIYRCNAKVNYEDGMLTFDFPNGDSESFSWLLGVQVHKLLVKNGHVKC